MRLGIRNILISSKLAIQFVQPVIVHQKLIIKLVLIVKVLQEVNEYLTNNFLKLISVVDKNEKRDDSVARYDKICEQVKKILSKFTLFQFNIIPQSDYYTSNAFQNFANSEGGQNLVGRTGLEKTVFLNVSLSNFQGQYLNVEFKCDISTANKKKEFCAISEYFIVVHYCLSFCLGCTSLIACSSFS